MFAFSEQVLVAKVPSLTLEIRFWGVLVRDSSGPKYGLFNHVSLADLVQPSAYWHLIFTMTSIVGLIELKRISLEL